MKVKTLLGTIIVGQSALLAQSTFPMYENLKFGEKKDTVVKKLDKALGGQSVISQTTTTTSPSKRPSGKKATLFGVDIGSGSGGGTSTVTHQAYKTKMTVSGLSFFVYPKWTAKGSNEVLNSLTLISEEATRTTLTSVYNELSGTLSSIYGKPVFENGIPENNVVKNVNSYNYGGMWAYGNQAVGLALGKTTKGYTITVDFLSQKPSFLKNSQ